MHPKGSRDGRKSYVVHLDYGHGFERYGSHDDFDSGWNVSVPDGFGASKHVGSASVHDLPKALLLEEARAGLRTAGDTLVRPP